MISCDTNILFTALDSASAQHERAKGFIADVSKSDRFAVCELVLVELYVLLRNPVVSRDPYTAQEAVAVIERFRSHPKWRVIDYPGPQAGIMKAYWQTVAAGAFPYRWTYDARLALTLRHHGITDFATRNVKDFEGLGFAKVWDPLV